MSIPTIHGPKGFVAASKLIDAAAESLSLIKGEDDLTDKDIGEALGKHHDQAGKYRTSLAEMPFTTFVRGCERWNGRFADKVFSKIGMKLVPLDTGEEVGRASATALTKLLWQLSVALEDGSVTDAELLAMRRELDEAGRAIDAMRERLGPKAA